jgi:Flp pilus assembly protein TadB
MTGTTHERFEATAGGRVEGKDREPLRPPPWTDWLSGGTLLRWFLRASAAFFALMFVVAVVHHSWWLVAAGLLGGTSALFQLREHKRKAAKNRPLSN